VATAAVLLGGLLRIRHVVTRKGEELNRTETGSREQSVKRNKVSTPCLGSGRHSEYIVRLNHSAPCNCPMTDAQALMHRFNNRVNLTRLMTTRSQPSVACWQDTFHFHTRESAISRGLDTKLASAGVGFVEKDLSACNNVKVQVPTESCCLLQIRSALQRQYLRTHQCSRTSGRRTAKKDRNPDIAILETDRTGTRLYKARVQDNF
jgi:hypothetical protein